MVYRYCNLASFVFMMIASAISISTYISNQSLEVMTPTTANIISTPSLSLSNNSSLAYNIIQREAEDDHHGLLKNDAEELIQLQHHHQQQQKQQQNNSNRRRQQQGFEQNRSEYTATTTGINISNDNSSDANDDLVVVPPGVIIFFHIAKSGGTTIRNNILKNENVAYERVYNKGNLKKIDGIIQQYLSGENNNNKKNNNNNKKTTLFVELHGNSGDPAPGIVALHPYLKKWRRNAERPLFAFTVIRDPVSFYVSYLNHFKHSRCKFHWCDPPLYQHMNETSLLESFVPNHQSIYMSRQYKKKHAKYQDDPLTEEECETLNDLMWKDLDWIGTTEQLKHATWPQISKRITVTVETPSTTAAAAPAAGEAASVSNRETTEKKQKEPIELQTYNVNTKETRLHRNDLSKDGIAKLESASQCDLLLYKRVQQDFEAEYWKTKR